MKRLGLLAVCLPLVVGLAGCDIADDVFNSGPDPLKVAKPLAKAAKAGESKKFCRMLDPKFRGTFRYKNTTRTYKCNLKSIRKTVIGPWETKRFFSSKVLIDEQYEAKLRMDFGSGETADSAWLVTLKRDAIPKDDPWRVTNIQTLTGIQFGIG